MGGIFDTDVKRNPWALANKVFVGYCSSDSWVGWSEAWFNIGHGDLTVYFRGQKIVEGVVATLMAPEFGLATASRILFGGCSEGGRGAMATIDYMTGKEPAGASQVQFPTTADVRGFFDGAMQLDIDVYDTAVAAVSMQNQTAEALVYLNATGRMGSNCNLAFDPFPSHVVRAVRGSRPRRSRA